MKALKVILLIWLGTATCSVGVLWANAQSSKTGDYPVTVRVGEVEIDGVLCAKTVMETGVYEDGTKVTTTLCANEHVSGYIGHDGHKVTVDCENYGFYWSPYAVERVTGGVDLVLTPDIHSARVGDIVELEIVANTSDEAWNVAAIDVLLGWDSEALQLLDVDHTLSSYEWFVSDFLLQPDGINDDLTDGDALYTVLSDPGVPAVVDHCGGFSVGTVRFMALAVGVTQVDLLPSMGTYGKTRVLAYDTPNLELTNEISGSKVRVR